MHYPLDKQFHPGFLVKSSKPSGPVEIDWRSPMTRGLRVYWIAQQAKIPMDLCNQAHLTTAGSAGYPDVFFDEVGSYLWTDGTNNQRADSPNSVAWDIGTNGAFTICAHVKTDTVNFGASGFNSLWGNGSFVPALYVQTGGVTRAWGLYHSNRDEANTLLSDNTEYKLTVVRPGTNTVYFYLDGVADGSSVNGIAWPTQVQHLFTSDGASEGNSKIYSLGIWERELSEEEIKLWAEEPYFHIVKPKADPLFYAEAAAGAAANPKGVFGLPLRGPLERVVYS